MTKTYELRTPNLPAALDQLLRSAIGFERMFSNNRLYSGSSYPAYNIEAVGEDDYVISLALAGWSKDDVEVSVDNGILHVSGKVSDKNEEGQKNFLFRGIAERSFKRSFALAEHVEVVEAGMENGVLTIKLHREVPEAKKPKLISIR